jgi:large subunit ribosomal protein L18
MARGPTYRLPLRRRREGRTDFRHRLGLLKSRKPRVVVRKTNNNMIVQFVEYDETGDRIVAAATALEARKFGFTGHTGNLSAAYLAGLLAGQRAKKAGIETAVLDIGLQAPVPGSRIFAGLAGAVAAGIDIPHGETVLPSEDRVSGAQKGDEAVQSFEKAKAAILGGGSE